MRRDLFEVEEDVDGAFSGIGAEPVANVVIVDWEIAENLRGFVLQAREISFEFGFVEELIGLDGKRFEDFAFSGDGEAGKDEAGHFKLRAFSDARFVGDGVGGIVERFDGLDFRFEIAAAAVLFFDVIPACKNFLAVGEFGGFHGEEVVEIVGGENRIASPLHAREMVDSTGVHGNVDGNLRGELFGGWAGEANLWRAELDAEKSFFEIPRADLFGEENVDCEAGVRFAAQLAEMCLDSTVGVKSRIAEFDGRDLKRGALDGKRLHVAIADGILHDLMLDGDVEFVRGEKGFDGVSGGVNERAGFGKRAVVCGIFCADGGGKLGIVEPGNVVEKGGKKRIFFDVIRDGDLIAARVEFVLNVGEEASADEFIGTSLERVTVHGRV